MAFILKQFPQFIVVLLLSLSLPLFISLCIAAPHNNNNNNNKQNGRGKGKVASDSDPICASTRNPGYCKHVFGNQKGNNVYDFGRISFQKSFLHSRKFLSLVNSHLQQSPNSSYSPSTIQALQDCQFLTQLNLQYIGNTYPIVNRSSDYLPSSQAEDFQTFLSAILTNQDTCLGGLTTSSDSSVKDELSIPLSDDTNLHSLSLDLFVKGWVPDKKNSQSSSSPNNGNGRQFGLQNGHTRLKMSKKARNMYDHARGGGGHGRKLLQSVGDSSTFDSVVIRDIVVVSQDGTGNFTTINAAISAAPINTRASDGYFLIYVTKGVYEENVSIPKSKNNLMMLGDGINQTIITGNRSVVDGWTTFSSATFGKLQISSYKYTNKLTKILF